MSEPKFNPKALYVIRNRATGKYWNGKSAKCDRDDILEATAFENIERAFVKTTSDEEWVKLP